ncbi:ATP-binding protein [Pseudomonas syringae]|uniref:ATP-binding protein n=1 Tax=Pseudomonas syringae TaxID=317 RepID=UPI003F74FAC1
MKIVYNGRASRRNNSLPVGSEDVLELLSNDWNDYGFETTFITVCRVAGERIELGAIRILFEKHSNSRTYLNARLKEGWDGEFPIDGISYVSIPSEISFYEQIDGALSNTAAVRVAKNLRDASYLVHVSEDTNAQKLVSSAGFDNSLQRERGSVEAFNDGWKILDRSSLAARDVEFSFEDVFGKDSTLNLKFSQDQTSLPREINVLIGANGTGKSQLLHQLVDSWIADTTKKRARRFSEQPNISRLIVASYSPFELFPVDMAHSKLKDLDAYKYFGLRGKHAPNPKDGKSDSANLPVGLSREVPKRDTVDSLLSCVEDDQRFRHIKGWGQKIGTAERVLKVAIGFDTMALKLRANVDVKNLILDEDFHSLVKQVRHQGKSGLYIDIVPSIVEELDCQILSKGVVKPQGVVFLKDGKIQQLSSGQRLFAFLVINILGAIKRNSLILIDEPELFLHPSLEIQLIEMLKQILRSFNSRAVLATHSVSIVRETPSDCVHVFERGDDELRITHPPFQTFGGDVQRIATYVFGDGAVSKPFESWIEERLESLDANQLIESLKGHINEELIIQIHAMERGQW